MRILFLLTQSLDDPSGMGRYWPLARQMVRFGYQVEIAALHPAWRSVHPRSFVQEGVSVSYVAQMHVRREGNRRLYFSAPKLLAVTAAATAALTWTALRSNADVIYVAKAQPMNGLAGWLGTRLGRAGLALDCDDYEAASNTFGGAWQRGIVNWWEVRLPRLAHAVTVNTTFLAGRCVRAGVPPERVLLVPNGFDPDLFGPVPEAARDVIRNRWGLDGRKMVLYIGSLSFTNHPLLLLLDAFVQVRRRNSSALLLVVGGGEDYDAVVRAIEERGLTGHVVVTGRASRAEVPGIYAASHIVVDPVDDDDVARARSPLKIAESLAMGIPVVTGDVGDRAMMLGEGRAGVLVKPGCPESLAEGIISLLTDQERYAWASEQARVISPRFCWEHLAAEFVKVFSFF